MTSPPLTSAERGALAWLKSRCGSGVVCNDGVVLACGERAGVMRATWNRLRLRGLLSIAGRRLTLTPAGYAHDLGLKVAEAECVP